MVMYSKMLSTTQLGEIILNGKQTRMIVKPLLLNNSVILYYRLLFLTTK